LQNGYFHVASKFCTLRAFWQDTLYVLSKKKIAAAKFSLFNFFNFSFQLFYTENDLQKQYTNKDKQ